MHNVWREFKKNCIFFRILDLENKCERLLKTNKELDDKISACDEQIKVF